MPEPTDQEVAAARALLAKIPEYRNLVAYGDDPTNSGVLKVGEAARLTGLSDDSIRTLAEQQMLHGAILYPSTMGWRIPYSSLVTYIAQLARRSNPNTDAAAG